MSDREIIGKQNKEIRELKALIKRKDEYICLLREEKEEKNGNRK